MLQSRDKLRAKADALPDSPGIYLMKDSGDEVIYVGKAKSLRARVRGYFQQSADEDRLITRQIAEVADVDVVVASSEKEAFILETNFIKQFRPKYNVLYRDDKSLVSIKIPLGEPWPRPVVTRKLADENALYFGPYASARSARRTLLVLQNVFPLRKCSLRHCRGAKRPCVYGEMGKCLAPCCEEVPEEQYKRLIEQVTMFLRGKSDELIGQLKAQMQQASETLDFERAARLRDRIQAIETTLEKQRVGSSAGDVDRDVFGIAATDRSVRIAILFARGGNVERFSCYAFDALLGPRRAICESFVSQFYAANRFIPDEVLLPVEIEDAGLLAELLSEEKGRKVAVTCPKRGEKKRLIELADRNAVEAERISTSAQEKRRQEMESLQQILGLDELPRNIECFDISTLHGREAVGSMVVFREGEPDKSACRRYRIKRVKGQDDFAMMHEVLSRRCRRAGETPLPDLMVVDGGKGQLDAARKALSELGLGCQQVVALAKARATGGRKLKGERVFMHGRSEPKALPEHSGGSRLITRIRDEAHRFALAYHRLLRRKAAITSPLTEIPGIGPTIAARLLEHFGSLDRLSAATCEELQAVRGVSERLARTIHTRLRP